MSRSILLAALVAVLAGPASAQEAPVDERGFPFITNYSPRDFAGLSQVWCALQDHRGIMLFCGGDGVMEFDGTSWRKTSVPNGSTIRSMALGEGGVIFVGAVGDLGYLESDEAGQSRFLSLVDELPEDVRDFTDVWRTLVGPDGVYFLTVKHIYRWDGSAFTVLTADEQWHQSNFVHGELYARQWTIGLGKFVDDEFVLLEGGERFADERVYVMLPWDEERILFGTRTEGLLLYDGQTFERFRTEADDFLLESQLYLPGLELADGSFVLGTVYGGAVRIGRDGSLIQTLTKETGIINDAVYWVAGDSQGDIWLTTDTGISRVEVGSPFTVFDERSGMPTQPYVMNRDKGRLYVGHQGGIYEMQGGQFKDLPGIAEQIFYIASVGDKLLAAGTQNGVFEVLSDRVELAVGSTNRFSTWFLLPSSWDDSIVFAGMSDGVAVIQQTAGGGWAETSRVEFVGNASTIVEDEPGTLWIGSQTNGVYQITFPIVHGLPDLAQASVEQFGEQYGLPGNAILIYKIAGRNYFVADDAIYTFDEVSQRFERDDLFSFDSFSGLGQLVELESGVVWSFLGEKLAFGVPQEDGSYAWTRQPFVRLDESQPQYVYPEEDGVTWFATLDGLVRYNPDLAVTESAPVSALIRRVSLGTDSLLFGGSSGPVPAPELAFSDNELHFEFATPSFTETSKNRYQTKLEGFDRAWSEWNADSRRAYTNLPSGDYEFLVRARNVEGSESPIESYAFRILPPWYRTWWAYLAYVLGTGGLLFGFVKLRTGQLQERQRELEQTVEDRTGEIRELLKRSDQRATELGTVNEISGALVAQLEFDSLVKLVGDQVRDTFNADIVYVALLDPDRKLINFPYGYGEEFPTLEYGVGLASQIIKTGEPLLLNEDVDQKHQEMGVETVGTAAASYLGVPISERGQVVGVVSVQTIHEGGRFDEDDLHLLATIASNVGIALQNAHSYQELNKTLEDLRSTQEQLVTQEKMASLGQLTAGIAHEIKNPLNFVNNFSELNQELASDLMDEMKGARGKKIDDVYEDLFEILMSLKTNAAQIAKHGKRADSIVKNMMQHASGGSTERFRVEVNAFVDEYVGLSYHGMRAQNPNMNVHIVKNFDDRAGNAEMSPQELGRVLLNLVNNALYTVHERASTTNGEYKPTVTVSTKRESGHLEIRVEDNGTGMPDHVKEHIFEPLFTTKPTGSGTGLGLSLAFDIVTQSHGGEMRVETVDGEGSTFVVRIPA